MLRLAIILCPYKQRRRKNRFTTVNSEITASIYLLQFYHFRLKYDFNLCDIEKILFNSQKKVRIYCNNKNIAIISAFTSSIVGKVYILEQSFLICTIKLIIMCRKCILNELLVTQVSYR